MIELRDWTTEKPTKPGWYAYRCPDPTTGIEFAFQFDFVFAKIYDMAAKGDPILCANLPLVGAMVPIRLAGISGEWCGPFVMGE